MEENQGTRTEIPEYLLPVYDRLIVDGHIVHKIGPMGEFDVMSDEAWKQLADAQYDHAQAEYQKSVKDKSKKESINDTTNKK